MSKQTFITDEKILKFIKEMNGEIGRRKLSEVLNISERRARKMLSKYSEIHENVKLSSVTDKDVAEYLKGRGLSVESVISILTPKKEIIHAFETERLTEFAIGLTTDSHLSDKECALHEFHDYHEKCKQAGVIAMFNSGDITAGMNVYKGMTYDLINHGFDAQLKYAAMNYPKIDGIKTYAINGNHDLSFKVEAGANFVEALANMRDDIIHVGDYDGTVSVNGVQIGLHHGGGGVGYSPSYKMQRLIEKIGGGQKPHIYSLGHFHTMLQMIIRGVHCFMPACWQKPNDFSVRFGFPNTIGGYILYIKVADDEYKTIRSMKSEFISYY